ncbi:MAG: ABC transporter ATP-binding protein [Spirochaetales bacterium]|nr:ABC transporter ATP-binding protein [Spirochaetales bacterium]
MIKTIDMEKIYRSEEIDTQALDKVNLEISKGDFVAIMGPSGCGKSTLLNLLGLLDTPSAGKYFFMGKDVTSFSEKQRALLRKGTIGFVFQSFNLIEELTVFENIELPLLYMRYAKHKRIKRVGEIMDRLTIAHRRNHFPHQLSGGQQQRVAVARAVVTKPEIILADEPTGNLDSRNGEEVMQILCELHEKGTTLVIVTHAQEYAFYAERIIYLLDGHIVAENS